MELHPTRAAVDLAIAGIVGVAVGVATGQAAVVAWTGALLVGLTIARAVTRLSVSRVRAAGFEMLWKSEPRVRRVARGEVVELEAEVRNRDTRAARYVSLRATASPELTLTVDPSEGEVPASGRLGVTIAISAPRVGRYGIHGLSLEVEGNPGLYEVPLTFANPFGIEALPRAFGLAMRSARGGRSRMTAEAGRPGPLSGDGGELRELREHQTGDPFKRIAWKASARRGVLLVRDYEREERDIVWLLLDASTEHWAGVPGQAPLDLAIDEVAAVAERHLARGDRVGLAIVASRVLAWLPPERGPAHGIALMNALANQTGTLDADRSALDEVGVALRVLEHLRPLDPAATAEVRASELDRVVRRAERARERAPFPALSPWAAGRRERALRRYLSAFGIGSPPRAEPEQPRTDRRLAETLTRLRRERPTPSLIYLWSSPFDPSARPDLARALAEQPRRGVTIGWIDMIPERGVPRHESPLAGIIADAVEVRARAARTRGERALRRLGVRVERLRARAGEAGEPRGR